MIGQMSSGPPEGRPPHSMWTMGRCAGCAAIGLLWLSNGCTQTMEPGDGTPVTPWSGGASATPPAVPGAAPVGGSIGIAGSTGVGGTVTVVPPPEIIDSREPELPERAPPPISGGTLLALSDGQRAVVADPDRDRLVVANYQGMYLDAILELEPGAEPGRLIEGDGQVYVALRGTGQVATLDLETLSVAEIRPACQLPRGLALSPARDSLFVACAEGKLVELPLSGEEVIGQVPVDLDVRDVFFVGEQLMISRFRAAELLELGTEREVLRRRNVPMVGESLHATDNGFPPPLENQVALFESSLAWRTTTAADGTIVVAHQRATSEPILLHGRHGDDDPDEPTQPEPDGDSEYGSSSGCGGIVHTGVTSFHPDGTTTTSPQLAGVVLPVDVAVSKTGMVAVANAGMSDLSGPRSNFVFTGSVALLTEFQLDRAQAGADCVSTGMLMVGSDPAIAVAFDPVNDLLLAQSREPSQLLIADLSTGATRLMQLTGVSTRHTGHEVFHRDAGTGIACASCHAEGSEDGRIWNFDPLGARRTQPLDVSLRDSAPFHWDGEMDDLGMLMDEVFVERMGGVRQSEARLEALADWIFDLRPRPSLRAAGDPAVERGRALFDSDEVACATCHSGPRFSNNLSADVGTGGPLQIPSLLGVAHRPPFLHTGCAATLLERFDPECGGDSHGNVADLTDADRLDLVAYLESL